MKNRNNNSHNKTIKKILLLLMISLKIYYKKIIHLQLPCLKNKIKKYNKKIAKMKIKQKISNQEIIHKIKNLILSKMEMNYTNKK